MRLILIFVITTGSLLSAVIGRVGLSGDPGQQPDERLYQAAGRSFQGAHWNTSAQWFNELITRFPDSPRRPKAILLLGESLFKQEKYKDAYGVLSNNRLTAGKLADEYLYWMAECRLGQGNLDAADQVFAELLRDFPESSRVLESTIASAFVSAQREDWPRIITLLSPTEGVFQQEISGGDIDDLLQEGVLLLAEALLQQKNPQSARIFLEKLPRALEKARAWRRDLLKVRIIESIGNFNEAFKIVSKMKVSSGVPDELFAQVVRLQSQLLVRQKKWGQAADVYEVLFDRRFDESIREISYFESANILFRGGESISAINCLERLLKDPELRKSYHVAHCILGEAKISTGYEGANAALGHFKKALEGPVVEGLEARALWGLGRCYHLLDDPVQSEEFFFKSVEKVDSDYLRARILYDDAYSKIQTNRWLEAGKGFEAVVAMSGVKDSTLLRDQALFMQIKSMASLTNLAQAKPLLRELEGAQEELINMSIFLIGQAYGVAGVVDEANEFLIDLKKRNPGERLLAAAELENVRVHVKQRNWTKALALYNKWLKDYPDHDMAAGVRLDRAWVLSSSGQANDAVNAYDEIINIYPKSPESYLAKMWKADRMFNLKSERLQAERLYQEIAGSTNSPPQIRQRAMMMSGRAAVARQGYEDAWKSFSALLNNPAVLDNVRTEATFALGDLTLMNLDSPSIDALTRITQSTNAFYSLIQNAPLSLLAARSWGRIGDSCRLAARDRPKFYDHAIQAYQNSLAASDKIPPGMKSHALMGLAYALEGSSDERGPLNQAVNHVLSVFYGRHLDLDQKQDPYWRGQSGLAALRMLENQNQYEQAIGICGELEQAFPSMREALLLRRERLKKFLIKKPGLE